MGLFKQPSKAEGSASKRQKVINTDPHVCIPCKRTLSRGNEATRKRHAGSCHKGDSAYNFHKDIVPANHQLAVAAISIPKVDTVEPTLPLQSSAAVTTPLEQSTVTVPVAVVQSTLQLQNHPPKSTGTLDDVAAMCTEILARLNLDHSSKKEISPAVALNSQSSDCVADATCLPETEGSVIQFLVCGDGGIVRCRPCYEYLCDTQPGSRMTDDPIAAEEKIRR